jgi:prepilin signal peptidase PulO-like enzyme (type II secretory pathway)
MHRCPECNAKLKHYSMKKLYKSNRRYYKCKSCGTSFITAYVVTETVIKVKGGVSKWLSG